MSDLKRKALLELAKRQQSKIDWSAESFPKQWAFLTDTGRMKASLCTRRAGKSYGVGLLAVKTALDFPGTKTVIIGKTRESIRDIYFEDIMEVLRRKYNLKWDLNKTEMVYRLSNGSSIKFMGADADADQMKKLLGQKFKLAVIDEASMYSNIDLMELCYGILRPALADHNGTLVMIGTPSDYIDSFYFRVTTGQELGWSLHKWTAHDNPHMAKQIAEEEKFIDETNPKYRETALYRQHNLGEWVVRDDFKMYKYVSKVNSTTEPLKKGYQTVLGVDLGYEDDTAFVVGAWSHYDPILHIIHCESYPGMLLDDVEKKIKQLQARYDIGIITVDGAGKQFVETLQQRFKTALHRAEKIHKKDFVELMNADFQMGRIDVLENMCQPLIKEWDKLIWDEAARDKTGEWKEIRTAPNHAADAALYMWRWCYNFAHIPKTRPQTEEERYEQQRHDAIVARESDTVLFNSQDDWGF